MLKSRRNPHTPLGVVGTRGRSSSEPRSPPGQKAQKLRMPPPEADEDKGRLRRPPKERSPRRQLRDRRPVPRQRPRFVITKRTEVPSFFLAYARLSRASPKADPSEDSQPTQQLEDPATSKRCHNRDARKPSACKGFRKRPSFGWPLA